MKSIASVPTVLVWKVHSVNSFLADEEPVVNSTFFANVQFLAFTKPDAFLNPPVR